MDPRLRGDDVAGRKMLEKVRSAVLLLLGFLGLAFALEVLAVRLLVGLDVLELPFAVAHGVELLPDELRCVVLLVAI